MEFFNRSEYKSESAKTLLEPKEIEIDGCKFIISRMPCTVAQEVMVNLPQGLIPILSEFTKYEQYIYKMLSYCERLYDDGRSVPLVSKAIIDNNILKVDTLLKLEYECVKYNYDFFTDGSLLPLWEKLRSLVTSSGSKMWTDLLHHLSQAVERAFTSLKTYIH